MQHELSALVLLRQRLLVVLAIAAQRGILLLLETVIDEFHHAFPNIHPFYDSFNFLGLVLCVQKSHFEQHLES